MFQKSLNTLKHLISWRDRMNLLWSLWASIEEGPTWRKKLETMSRVFPSVAQGRWNVQPKIHKKFYFNFMQSDIVHSNQNSWGITDPLSFSRDVPELKSYSLLSGPLSVPSRRLSLTFISHIHWKRIFNLICWVPINRNWAATQKTGRMKAQTKSIF